MRLVVGLGNPGSEFAGTRHNVGSEALEELAVRLGWIGSKDEYNRLGRSKFQGITLDGSVSIHGGAIEKLLLLKPTTYMNDSGRSVQSAMAFYQLSPQEVMVILDDLALPSGKIRIRLGGSAGGHNGLKDIERVLGTEQYPRLRIGIDAPPPTMSGRDYVLERFTPDQRRSVEPALRRAASAVLTWIEKGIETAMNEFNAEATEQ